MDTLIVAVTYLLTYLHARRASDAKREDILLLALRCSKRRQHVQRCQRAGQRRDNGRRNNEPKTFLLPAEAKAVLFWLSFFPCYQDNSRTAATSLMKFCTNMYILAEVGVCKILVVIGIGIRIQDRIFGFFTITR